MFEPTPPRRLLVLVLWCQLAKQSCQQATTPTEVLQAHGLKHNTAPVPEHDGAAEHGKDSHKLLRAVGSKFTAVALNDDSEIIWNLHALHVPNYLPLLHKHAHVTGASSHMMSRYEDPETNSSATDLSRSVPEYDFPMQSNFTFRSKVVLAVVEVFGLGTCGIDRCIMGQKCLGVVKGLTLGALGIWTLVDYIVIIFNCLSRSPEIKAVSYDSKFAPTSIGPAFSVVMIVLVIKAVFTVFHCLAMYRQKKIVPSLWARKLPSKG